MSSPDTVQEVSDDDAPSNDAPPGVPPRDPARKSSHRPLRPRDSMGALRPSQAQVDQAHARGYAEGLEEARTDATDTLRTLLAQLVEGRFGPLEERAILCIEEAEDATLQRWIVATPRSETMDEVFAK